MLNGDFFSDDDNDNKNDKDGYKDEQSRVNHNKETMKKTTTTKTTIMI